MLTKEAIKYLGCSAKTLDRYKNNGSLNPVKIEGKWNYSKDELMDVAKTIKDKKNRHRPDKRDEDYVEPSKDVKVKDEELLDKHGQAELLRITEHLRDKGILDLSDKGVIMRYALAIQMKDRYLKKGEVTDESFYFNVAKQFQSEIQYSEKALGITAESASKLTIDKPREKSEMETLLNG